MGFIGGTQEDNLIRAVRDGDGRKINEAHQKLIDKVPSAPSKDWYVKTYSR